jgi:hypothetical protein
MTSLPRRRPTLLASRRASPSRSAACRPASSSTASERSATATHGCSLATLRLELRWPLFLAQQSSCDVLPLVSPHPASASARRSWKSSGSGDSKTVTLGSNASDAMPKQAPLPQPGPDAFLQPRTSSVQCAADPTHLPAPRPLPQGSAGGPSLRALDGVHGTPYSGTGPPRHASLPIRSSARSGIRCGPSDPRVAGHRRTIRRPSALNLGLDGRCRLGPFAARAITAASAAPTSNGGWRTRATVTTA